MLQGMFGKRLAERFSLLESSSLVLSPKGNSRVALTEVDPVVKTIFAPR